MIDFSIIAFLHLIDNCDIFQKCRQRDPTLTIKYKQKKLEQAGKEEAAKKAKKRQEKKESTPQYPHCGECIACYRVDNCNKCDACRGKSRQQCKYRVCLTFAPKVSLNFKCLYTNNN